MLSTLNPKFVWQIFNDICKIPHPSHHEQMITKYIVDFATTHHIDCQLDKAGNVLLRKAATKGMEDCPSIALQAHMDMVPQKNEGTQHDFLVDPIQAYVDGDWVKAKGTTLGADNGVGLASALAVLIDPSVEHGPLEVLVTTSEETGMHGAFGLQPNWLKSHYLINTDSEDEGEIFTGCAGGVDFTTSFAITYAVMPEIHDCYIQLSLKGLKGGHSGCDIHLGRGNAIPREAFAELTLNKQDLPKLEQIVNQYNSVLQNEFGQVEPNIELTLKEVNNDHIKRVIAVEQQSKIINLLNVAPNGVVSMSTQIHGVVETSLNLGIVSISNNQLNVNFLIRSQVDSAKDAVVATLISLSQLVNANYEINGGYSGWEPNLNSSLLQLAKDKYQEIFSKQAKIMVIHAGLECGLFKQSYPDMDMISIGPTIVSPHSPDEKVNIQSVYRYWELLIAILKSACYLK